MSTYATYAEFTQVYSLKNITETEISSYFLPYGALRVNEALGGVYSIPFSSNNLTAKNLSIQYAYLGVLLRTRNSTDSEEIKKDIEERIADIKAGNSYMSTEDGAVIYPDAESTNSFFSTSQNYKPVFDMRGAMFQRVDPDQIDAEWDADV